MKATEARLLEFLKRSHQFVIPIYQRTYSWTEKECRQLWDDIIRAGSDKKISVHFIGSIVYVEDGIFAVMNQPPLLVIDGQQRLTTLTLILAALAQSLGDTEPAPGFSRDMVRGYYLMNPLERGERKFKLLLSQTDKASLTAIVGEQEQPKEHSLRVTRNYELFCELLKARHGDLAVVCEGLAKLVVVDIALNRSQDNPQLIFESMNSTGKELSQADLIRNFILMGLEPELQTKLYESYWRPMETDFGQEAYGTHFDDFMRQYLTLKTGDIPRLDGVYEAFKEHSRSVNVAEAGVEALVKDIRKFAKYYGAIALGAESDNELKQAFHDIHELRVDVAYPFLLQLCEDHASGLISKAEFLTIIRMVESYVFRRSICSIPTNSLNKTFVDVLGFIKRDRYFESIQAFFLSRTSYRRFPSDDEFRREIQKRDLYNYRVRRYWLRRIENHGRKERVQVDEYTIEHIMPQNENLSADWKASLGPDWERIQETWLHTLGNLTLTAYNSEFSDRPFVEKRDMPHSPEKGFRQSPLKLNQGLGVLETWNESTIQARAARLADFAVGIWGAPKLAPEILNSYKPAASSNATYTIADHPYLSNAVAGPLFQEFRKAVLALDPCVTEEFLKIYVAYKGESNFVDVIPQSKRLRLIICIKFLDIIDPKGLCRDVSKIGRWGNGEVEIFLSNQDELPYVIGLVRQALDWQLGNSAE